MYQRGNSEEGRAVTAHLGRHRLVYRRFGSGDHPPLLLVHGLSGSARWWRHNTPALSRRFCVYEIELVGYGNNRAFKPITIREAAQTLGEFIAAYLPGGRAHVLGHSMGGQIATHLAAEEPERIDRLILAAASGMLRSNLARMALRLPGEAVRMAPTFAPTLAFDALRAGPLNLLRSTLDILSDDVEEDLEKIAAPTLLLWGDRDRLVPVSVGEAVWHRIPEAQFKILHGAGHVLMWDRPQAFNRTVLEFLPTGGEQQEREEQG